MLYTRTLVTTFIFSILACFASLSCSYSSTINDVKISISKQNEEIVALIEHNYYNKCIISCINSTIILRFNEPVNNIIKQGIDFKYNTANQNKLITFSIPNLPAGFKMVSNIKHINKTRIIFAKNKPQLKIYNEPIKKSKKFLPIYIEHKQNQYTICVPFFKGKSSVIQNDAHLWIVIDNKDYCENLIAPNALKPIHSWKSVKCSSANIYRADITNLKAINVQIDQNRKILQIDLSKDIEAKLQNTAIKMSEMPNCYKFNPQSGFSCHKFFDTVTKETINIVALEDASYGIMEPFNSFYCKILPTIQGIAFKDFNQELEVANIDSEILIKKNSNFDSNKCSESILPWKNKLTDTNIYDQIDKLQKEIDSIQEPNKKISKMLTLAKLYFSSELYHEAFSIMKDIKNDNNKILFEDVNIQFFEAVLQFLCKQEKKAAESFRNIAKKHNKKYIPTEIALWHHYTNNISNKDDDNLFLMNIDNYLKHYHQDVLFKMITDFCNKYIDNQQLSRAKSLLSKIPTKQINKHLDDDLHQKYICYSIKIMLLLGDVYKAESSLLKFCDNNPAIRQKFLLPNLLLTKILYNNNKLSIKEALIALEDYKFLVKDSKTEIELLQFMADLHEKSENYIQSLRILKYIQENLSDVYDQDLNKSVRELYNRIFIEKDFINELNDFDAVSTFIEFQDLLPIDNQGDEIVMKIINKLVNLDLLSQAIALLEHQVTYRVQKNDIYILNIDHLALLYLLNKEPIKACQILDSTEEYNLSLKEHQKRLMIRSKALLNAKDYNNALKCIKNVESNDSFIIHKEILFQSQQWQNYVSLVGPYVLSKLQNEIEIEQDKHLINDIVKLYISLIKIGDNLSCEHIISMLNKVNKEIAKEVKSLSSNKPSVNIFDKYSVRDQTEILMDEYRKNLFNSN